jgi:hypothetical protein
MDFIQLAKAVARAIDELTPPQFLHRHRLQNRRSLAARSGANAL